ncbi:conserved hypothetical protein, partial [Ricinus communis]
MRRAGPPRAFAQAESFQSLLLQDGAGRVEQGRAQVAVVVIVHESSHLDTGKMQGYSEAPIIVQRLAMTDLVLAIVHHLIVFGIASALAAELALMRPAAMSPQTVRLLGRFDAAYGIMALAILVVGFLRVKYGAKGAGFYMHNPMFWAKIAAFA